MKINRGDRIAIYSPKRFEQPFEAKVIAITREPGKTIGVQCDQPVEGGHTCDGRGPEKCCLWIHPDHVILRDQIPAIKQKIEERKAQVENLRKQRAEEENLILVNGEVTVKK